MSSPPPVHVAIVDAYAIARLGLSAALAPFEERVRLVPSTADEQPAGQPLDVVLYEPIGLRADQQEQVRTLAERHRVPATVYSWRAVIGRSDAAPPIRLSKRLAPPELVEVLVQLGTAHRRARVEAELRGGDSPMTLEDQVQVAYDLSAREFEVLRLVAAGLSNQEICARLFLSVNSVKTYLRTGYRKIGADRRTQAVAWVLEHGLEIEVDEPTG
ncbi:helix-turn-helix transcriptional regulator [Nocardioides sambongensis]|uniref:helix-turn-helix transcriptional regulator n=1 Tax=Nocardioides sambongensis TaxID=2589074 RepID=UPI00112E4E44|nr:response regulator transcription factor [Nocardioides sambongensis]